MTIDQGTIDRVRRLLGDRTDDAIEEKRIVGGGFGFLVDGNLCCAVTTRGLTVRVGPEAKAEALTEPNAIPHLVGSRETAAFIVVEPAGIIDDAVLAKWIERALRFVATLC